MATRPPAIAALALLVVLAVVLVTTHEPSAVRPSIGVPSRPEAQEDGLPSGRSFCVLGIVFKSARAVRPLLAHLVAVSMLVWSC